MTFQLASGFSVWCGRGVRSGKKRSFFLRSALLARRPIAPKPIDDERAFAWTDDARPAGVDDEEMRRGKITEAFGEVERIESAAGEAIISPETSPSAESASSPSLGALCAARR